jgi:hypothetical protein
MVCESEEPIMTAQETISHFRDMGVLRHVMCGPDSKIKLITASASEGYAQRCMKDFFKLGWFCLTTAVNIISMTSDDVVVVMTVIPES